MAEIKYAGGFNNYVGQNFSIIVDLNNQLQIDELLKLVDIKGNISYAEEALEKAVSMTERAKKTRDKSVRNTASMYQERVDFLEKYIKELSSIEILNNESTIQVLVDLEIIKIE